MAAAASTPGPSFERRRPARRPLPEHLPRERIVYPAPSATLRKIGEDVTETAAAVESGPTRAREVLLPSL
jgi:transposase